MNTIKKTRDSTGESTSIIKRERLPLYGTLAGPAVAARKGNKAGPFVAQTVLSSGPPTLQSTKKSKAAWPKGHAALRCLKAFLHPENGCYGESWVRINAVLARSTR